jgi:hypothetical protein
MGYDTKIDVSVISSVLRPCPVELLVLNLRTLHVDTLSMIRLRALTPLHRYSCASARNADTVPCLSKVSCNPPGSTGLLNLLTYRPTARQRLSIHVPANTTVGAVFSVERYIIRC